MCVQLLSVAIITHITILQIIMNSSNIFGPATILLATAHQQNDRSRLVFFLNMKRPPVYIFYCLIIIFEPIKYAVINFQYVAQYVHCILSLETICHAYIRTKHMNGKNKIIFFLQMIEKVGKSNVTTEQKKRRLFELFHIITTATN